MIATDGFLLLTVAIGLVGAALLPSLAALATNMAFFVAALIPLAALHELGHAAAAMLVRTPVARISLGVGSVILFRRGRRCRLELRHGVSGGMVIAALRHPLRAFRWRLLALIVGGPAASIAVAVAMLTLSEPGLWWDRLSTVVDPWAAFGVASVFFVVVNLIPSRVMTAWGASASDSRAILILLTAGAKTLRLLHIERLVGGALIHLLDGRPREALSASEGAMSLVPDEPVARLLAAAACIEVGEFERAFGLLRRLEETAELSSGVRVGVHDRLAWIAIAHPELIAADEGRRHVDAMVAMVPWMQEAVGTQACFEAVHGDAELALQLAVSSRLRMERGSSAVEHRAAAAMALARLGRGREACEELASIRRERAVERRGDPANDALLALVERTIDATLGRDSTERCGAASVVEQEAIAARQSQLGAS